MIVKIESRANIEIDAYFKDDSFKSHACEVGDWWGEEICKRVNFNDVMNEIKLPEGEYKITISLEKI